MSACCRAWRVWWSQSSGEEEEVVVVEELVVDEEERRVVVLERRDGVLVVAMWILRIGALMEGWLVLGVGCGLCRVKTTE
jgi:hypothetical protein